MTSDVSARDVTLSWLVVAGVYRAVVFGTAIIREKIANISGEKSSTTFFAETEHTMATNPEDDILFAMSVPRPGRQDAPLLTVLLTDSAWQALRGDGCFHQSDLSYFGVALRVQIGRMETHATGMALLTKISGGTFKDVRDLDFGFDQEPTEQ